MRKQLDKRRHHRIGVFRTLNIPGGGGPSYLPFSPTMVADDGTLTASVSDYTFTAQTTPAWGDLGFYGSTQTRANGLAIVGKINLSTWEEFAVGWHDAGAIVDPATWKHAIYATATDGTIRTASGAEIATGLSASTEYPFAIVLGATSSGCYVKVGGAWKLFWVWYDTTATLYPVLASLDAAGVCRYRLAQLPAPFNTDYGLATDRLAGARSTGDTFTHEPDFIAGITVGTVGALSTCGFSFRRLSVDNRWWLELRPEKRVNLWERVSGANTMRGQSPSNVFENGQRIVVIAEDTTIKVYANNALVISYTSAENFKTATAGYLTKGYNWAVSDIVSWPRTLSGTAASVLSRYAK